MKRLRGMQAALVLVFLMGLSSTAWAHTDVTPQEAKDLIDANDNLMVVDVREEESEYCDENPTPPVPPGHIPGALNYPWSSGVLQERYGELPIDGEILIVCRSGSRSNQAAEFLDSKGYLNIYDMTSGMSNWQWETVVCIDSDSDDLNDDLDNCPDDYNPNQEDIDCDGIGDVCDGLIDCAEGVDCDNDCDGVYNQNDNCPDDPNPLQEDTYPPQGNGIGDACDCEADFNCNGNVDAVDVASFLLHFGRNQFSDPCIFANPCNGDFNCDSNVDATDVTKLLEDFGRNPFNDPCPVCVEETWCEELVCQDNLHCNPEFFCMKPTGQCDALGLCVQMPGSCPAVYFPVCGCDGNTYGNDCFAAGAGISVDYFGECL